MIKRTFVGWGAHGLLFRNGKWTGGDFEKIDQLGVLRHPMSHCQMDKEFKCLEMPLYERFTPIQKVFVKSCIPVVCIIICKRDLKN